MTSGLRRLAICAALSLAGVGCGAAETDAETDARHDAGEDGGTLTGAPGSFRCADGRDPVTDILGARVFPGCSASVCHGAPLGAGGLVLESDDLYTALVGRPSAACEERVLVADRDPDGSYLVAKLSGEELPDGCGDPMPAGATALADEDLACIREWIRDRGRSIAP